MNRSASLVALVVLLVVGSAAALTYTLRCVGPDRTSSVAGPPTPDPLHRPSRDASDPPGPSVDQRHPIPTGKTVLSGRLLDHETGAALPDVLVEAAEAATLRQFVTVPGVRTGGDGCFAMHLPFAERGYVRLRFSRRGYIEIFEMVPNIEVGTARDLGDVTLRCGWSIEGRVVQQGSGLGVQTSLRLTLVDPAGGPSLLILREPVLIQTDESGTFRVSQQLSVGRWLVSIPGGPPIVGRRSFDVTADRAPDPVLITVDVGSGLDTIRGTVRTRAGERLPDVVVTGSGSDLVHARSGRDGTYVLHASANPYRGDVLIGIRRWSRDGLPFRYQLSEPFIAAWGARDLDIVLDEVSPFFVRVIDEESRPIARFGVAVVAPTSGSGLPMRFETHEDGTALVHGVVDQVEHLVFVVPESSSHALSHPVRVRRVRGFPERLEVKLRSAGTMTIRCLLGEQPLAGAVVTILHANIWGPRAPTVPVTSITEMAGIGGADIGYATCITDERGCGSIDGVNIAEEGMIVRVQSPRALWFEVVAADVTTNGVATINVPEPGSVEVKYEHAGRRGLRLERMDGDPADQVLSLPLRTSDMFEFSKNGIATVPGVPAGKWAVFLVGHEQDDRSYLGALEVRRGQTARIECGQDGRGPRGKISGYVRIGDVPGVEVAIRGAGGELVAATDSTGYFVFPDVPIGSWEVVARVTEAVIPIADTEVEAGGDHKVDIELHGSRKRLRLVRTDGTPLPFETVVVEDQRGREWQRMTSSGHGEVSVTWLPRVGRLGVLPSAWQIMKWVEPNALRMTYRTSIAVSRVREAADGSDLVVD